MNVGLPPPRRSAVQVPRDAPRPRSPEAKGGPQNRARSPVGKQPAAPVPVVRSLAQSAQQQGLVKRNATSTVDEIKKIDLNREQRRRCAEETRRSRQEEAAALSSQCGGNFLAADIDFHRMIREFRQQCPPGRRVEVLEPSDPDGMVVCVRKRPIFQHESVQRELDCITACNPYAIVHERKFKVDGITKCLESHQFEFDWVFDESNSTEDLYRTVTQPLVPWVIENCGRTTLFAYGQTGSGKTYTMTGIQRQLANHIFSHISQRRGEPLEVSISFFEIYGGHPYDLLNNRQRCETLEDARSEVQIAGLAERPVSTPEQMLHCIEVGNSMRTTHATAMNRDSSRSHAICWVFIRARSAHNGIHSKITLVDLAGSERAADSKSTVRQRRVEGAQINKSLLALKECIRAMGSTKEAHVPFRASKLTLVLRDAFMPRCPSKTVMIACISPGITSADHSVNTLRYSDRLKDHPRARGPIPEQANGMDDGGALRPMLASSIAPPARETKSPGPRRGRSPSPAPEASMVGGNNQPMMKAKDSGSFDASGADGPPAPVAAWEAGGSAEVAAAPVDLPLSGGGGGVGGGRQSTGSTALQRRGRQPTLRPRETGAPSRQDVRPSRGSHSDGYAGSGSTSASYVAAPLAHAAHVQPVAPVAAAPCPEPVREAHAPTRAHHSQEEPSSPGGAQGRRRDLDDNRYLHNTLTSEVYERNSAPIGSGVVDVGVEDLADLAHMEALDEVRQWEDRIVSQHMVALQEDARLLTAESELLSQVQQGTSYDIDWYVSEVDKVVRRKMEVYAGFLEDLEVFKAQLRREESLSLTCQRRGIDNLDGSMERMEVPVGHSASSHGVAPRELAAGGNYESGAPQASPYLGQRGNSFAYDGNSHTTPRFTPQPQAAGTTVGIGVYPTVPALPGESL